MTQEVSHGVCCDVTESQNCTIQITFRPQKQRNKNVLVYLVHRSLSFGWINYNHLYKS